MADKRLFNSKLNSKGLEQSVSEDQARHMAQHQGATYLFIIQAHAGPKVVNEDGSEVISLIPDLVELVPEDHAEPIRRFQRALYLARPGQYGQEAFDGATQEEPSVEDAAAGVEAQIATDATGEPVGVWDGTCPSPDCELPEGHEGDHASLTAGLSSADA